MKLSILNLIFFKVAWLSVVFGAANGLALAGTAVVALVSIWHVAVANNKRREVILLVAAAVIGLIWESVLMAATVVDYGANAGALAPYWIIAMWVLFATTLNLGMRWLHRSLPVAMLFGAIGGPLSFLAGANIGAVVFPDATRSLIVIGIGWAVLLPLMVVLARRFDGHGAKTIANNRLQAAEASS